MKLRILTAKDLDTIPQVQKLGRDRIDAMRAVGHVLPFRANNYVCDQLIDWDNIPDDPIFQLSFSQPGMLAPADLSRMVDLIRGDASREEIAATASAIHDTLNPDVAGQKALNVPRIDGRPLPGLQHKYRETLLFFPLPAQTCHTYCSYCFRWPQFAKIPQGRFANPDPADMVAYLHQHPDITDVLFTGGDPMVMSTAVLCRFVEPLLEVEHVRNIRIGTKSLAWWPHRFVTDNDADELMRLFERIVATGRHLALMAHSSHPRELEPIVATQAITRVLSTGAVIRCQAPLIRNVNDSADTWAQLWRKQVTLGMIPYYFFVQRDTGARRYFEVSLARGLEIYRDAFSSVSGLARTVRGPSMSAAPGKILIDGVTTIEGKKAFVLKFIQARDPSWSSRIFLADYDTNAMWLDDLRPFDGEEFFFEPRMRELIATAELHATDDLDFGPEPTI